MRRFTIIAFAAAALVAACTAKAPTPAGDWHGVLNAGGQTYRLALDIEETSTGVFTGVTGSPDTGRWNTPMEDLTFADGVFSYAITTGNGGRFEGTWNAGDKTWAGDYTVGANTFPLTFETGKLELPVIDGADGKWLGTLDVQGIKLRIVFNVATNAYGTVATMDSPDQMALGIPVPTLARDGDKITFSMPSLLATYAGTLNTTGDAMSGKWVQAGQTFPLDLTRTEAEVAGPNRPQTPVEPFPYTVEDVSIPNPAAPGVTLACTLTLPQTRNIHPAAFLISGSGGQDRDETLLGHKPFAVLADHLTRAGIATLRCDDRGVAKSTGTFANAVPMDFATDAEAAVAFLKSRTDIDGKKIGLIGHSEGGVTGPIVAARNADIAFVVMMAGLGVPGDDLLIEQGVAIARSMGTPEDQLAVTRAINRAVYDAVLAAPDTASAKAAAKAILLEKGASLGMNADMAEAQATQVASTYMRALLSYDPAPVVPAIKAPVLAINGTLDMQVPYDQNLPALRMLLKDNPDATVVELPGLNHLFQTAKTGAPGEYADIEETFAPAALTTISDWIVKRMKP